MLQNNTNEYVFFYRLLVNLTTPTLLLYNEEVPTERTSRQYYQSIVQSLQNYKQAFADKNLWDVLSEKLTSLLALVRNIRYQFSNTFYIFYNKQYW